MPDFRQTLLCAIGVAVSIATPIALPSDRIADKVTPVARPFPLDEVRLLDGPFRDAMIRDQQFLLALDPDRLLHNFRAHRGARVACAAARRLGSAGRRAARAQRRPLPLRAVADVCQHRRRALQGARRSRWSRSWPGCRLRCRPAGFTRATSPHSPRSSSIASRNASPVWAPYYTLHKILAGLLDSYELCGNRQALDVLRTRRRAGCSSAWIGSRTSSSRRCSRPSSAA